MKEHVRGKLALICPKNFGETFKKDMNLRPYRTLTRDTDIVTRDK